MKVIIPMAGIGKRMRPHTLTVPKPLLPVAGKPIVEHLVNDLAAMSSEKFEEIAFVVGDFGNEVEKRLIEVAERAGAKGTIYYQEEALGTGHAILCAAHSLEGNVIVAFADTLFKTDFTFDSSTNGVIWVKQMDDPRSFGVVTTDINHHITGFVEKPEKFVSDLAIIGIYYFNDGALLCRELNHIIDHNIRDKGEYQLTTALENMKNKGIKFSAVPVKEWLDCGNKDATVTTNSRLLELGMGNGAKHINMTNRNGTIIEPCFIGKNAQIINSEIGPHVSIGDNSTVKDSIVRNTIIQSDSEIISANVCNSIVGNYVKYVGEGKNGKSKEISLGDYSTVV